MQQLSSACLLMSALLAEAEAVRKTKYSKKGGSARQFPWCFVARYSSLQMT